MQKTWVVSAEESGMQLLAFLKEKLPTQYSNRKIKQAIELNHCLINNRTERFASHIVAKGEIVSFNVNALEQNTQKISFDPHQILFQDEDLFFYRKPANMASDSEEFLSLFSSLFSPYLCHRLDKDTTGVLMIAKNKKTFESIKGLFKKHLIKKQYLAIADGQPQKPSGIIDDYLGEIRKYQGQTIWGKVDKAKGLHAVTKWKCETTGRDACLLHCYPETGRTHQIRVHLNSMGHPILGDYQYGKHFKCSYHATRCLLHALCLSFPHPVTGQILEVSAPLPQDFKKAMQILFNASFG